MTIRVGYWDCPSCHQKKNLGPDPICGGCGRPRGANVPFYTDDSAPVVEDPEMVARARAGADWTCKYCSADNRAGVMDCRQCGAGPDGAVRRAERLVPAPAGEAPKGRPTKGASSARVLGVLAAILALVGGAIWFFFVRTTTLHVTVVSAAWVKTAQIEERQTKKGGAWHDDVPDDARVVAKETKPRPKEVQDGTTKVKVGQKDLGNGMFEDLYEEKPNMVTKDVDDTWIRYEVDTWVKKETREKRSNDGTEPPDPTVDVDGATQRVGETTNGAVFALKGSDGKAYTFEVDASKDGAATLKRYEIGKSYSAQINTMGHVQSLGAP